MKITPILSITLMFYSPLAAHIETAECWEKQGKRIYCLADYHDAKFEKNCINNEQRRSILKGARVFKAPLIVEDSEGIFKIVDGIAKPAIGSRSLVDIYDRLKRDYAVPMAMSSLCHRADVPVANIEFRFFATSNGKLTLNEELNSLNARAEKTLSYNDGEELRPFYASVVKTYQDIVYKDGKVFFEDLAQKNKHVTPHDLFYAPYGSSVNIPLKKIFPESYLKNLDPYGKKKCLLKYYKTFLIDTEIVHAIAQNKDEDRIIVCAGNAHIERIASALIAMGYVRIDMHTGSRTDSEPDAIDLDAFFTKHEPEYATAQIQKKPIDHMLDIQCYFDKHPFVALASGLTIMCTLLGILASPVWSATLASKLAPKNPKVRSVIRKSLLAAVVTTTATGLYALFTPMKGN